MEKPYDQLKSENRQIRIDFYRQIHISNLSAREAIMDIWERTADIRDVSDVIVVNRDGEVSCFMWMRIRPEGFPVLYGSTHQGRL